MNKVKVGMFKLPGLTFDQEPSSDIVDDMMAWAKDNHCGFCAGPRLWSFKTEAQRDWFVLRWADHVPKRANKDT